MHPNMAKYGIWGEYLGNKTALTLKIEIRAISALLFKTVNFWPDLELRKIGWQKNCIRFGILPIFDINNRFFRFQITNKITVLNPLFANKAIEIFSKNQVC